MISNSEVKMIVGEEFHVRDSSDALRVEIELKLSAVTQVHRGLLNESEPIDILVHERDRILIKMKREVSKLLWKYLGEIPDA